MLDKKLCESVFNMAEPWHIVKLEKRQHTNRVDIWVSTKSSIGSVRQWFQRSPLSSSQSEMAIWQHLCLGECRVYIHAKLNEDRSVPWLGEKDCPFSRALVRQVTELFSERLSYSAICDLLNVDVEDVWAIKNAFDKGQLQLGEALSTEKIKDKAAIHSRQKKVKEGENLSRVPSAEDPIWLQVLSGEVELNIRQLGLKLLLKRVRTHFNNASDDETKMLRMQELRKYFVKHERFLQYELKQMM